MDIGESLSFDGHQIIYGVVRQAKRDWVQFAGIDRKSQLCDRTCSNATFLIAFADVLLGMTFLTGFGISRFR
jgi:hypothetical protein